MQKRIVIVTYVLGMTSLVIAFILRGLNIMGFRLGQSIPTGGSLVDYASFLDGRSDPSAHIDRLRRLRLGQETEPLGRRTCLPSEPSEDLPNLRASNRK